MPEITDIAGLRIELQGDASSATSMLSTFENKLLSFEKVVSSVATGIDRAMTAAITSVDALATKMDAPFLASVQSVNAARAAIDTLPGASDKAIASMAALAAETTGAGKAAVTAGEQFVAMGAGVKDGMAETRKATNLSTAALKRFVEMLEKARLASETPIVQQIKVKRESSNGGSGGGHGSGGFNELVAGATILAPLVMATKDAAEFDTSLTKLFATAGATGSMDDLRKQILSVAYEFGQMPDAVAQAMYPIVSMGYKGADGMKVLTASAKLARTSQMDLGDSANLIVKTMLTYRLGVNDLAHVIDVYTKAVTLSLVPGKDYGPSLDTVRVVGKQAGLSIEELSAALDVMTQHTKSASIGATYLKNFINGLIDPTTQMKKAAEAAGLGWLATGHGFDEIKKVGFGGVLKEIEQATHGNITALDQLFPDMRKNQAAMILLNDAGAKYNSTLKQLQNSHGANAEALTKQKQPLADLEARYHVLSITIGEKLIPVMNSLSDVILSVLDAFNNLTPGAQSALVYLATGTGVLLTLIGTFKMLGGAIGNVIKLFQSIVPAAAAAADAEGAAAVAGTAAMGPWVIAIAAVVTVIGGIALAWDHAKKAQEDYYNAAHTGDALTDAQTSLAQAQAALDEEKRSYNAGHKGAASGADQADEASALAPFNARVAQAQNVLTQLHANNAAFFTDNANRWQSTINGYQSALTPLLEKQKELTALLKADPDVARGVYRGKSSDEQGQLTDVTQQIQDLQAKISDASSKKNRYQEFADAISGGNQSSTSSGLANERVLDTLSGAAKAGLTSGLDKLGSCAEFASRVFQKAGIQVQSSMAAAVLQKNVEAAGGVKDSSPKAGDVVFFHGKKFGVIKDDQGMGEHVGFVQSVANGVPRITSSSGGRVKTNERYSAADLAQATFYTMPDTSVLDQGNAQPAWSQAYGNKTSATKRAVPAPVLDKVPTSLEDLIPGLAKHPQPGQDVLSQSHTDVSNYAAKMTATNDQLASSLAALDAQVQKEGLSFDDRTVKLRQNTIEQANLARQIAITNNAIASGKEAAAKSHAEAESVLPKAQSAASAYNDQAEAINRERRKGNQPSQADVDHLSKLRDAYKEVTAAAKSYSDASIMNENMVKVASDAAESQAKRKLALDEESLEIQKQIADQSQKALDTTLKGISRATESVTPGGDFAGQRDNLAETIAAMQAQRDKTLAARPDASVYGPQTAGYTVEAAQINAAIQKYSDLAAAKINLDEATSNLAISEKDEQTQYDLGKESVTDYRTSLEGLLVQYQGLLASSNAAGVENRALAETIDELELRIANLDWSEVQTQAQDAAQALAQGTITTQEYIDILTVLRSELPATAEEYKELTTTIASATREQTKAVEKAYDDQVKGAKKTADGIGEAFASGMMPVIEKTETLHDALRSMWKKLEEDIINTSIKNLIAAAAKPLIMRIKGIPAQDPAHSDAAKPPPFNAAVAAHAVAINLFGDYTQQFVAAVNNLLAHPLIGGGGAGGPSGPGTAPGGGKGTNATPASSGTGINPAIEAAGVAGTVAAVSSAFTKNSQVARDAGVAAGVASAADKVASAGSGAGAAIGATQAAMSATSGVASLFKNTAGLMSTLSSVAPVIGAVSAIIGIASLFHGPRRPSMSKFQAQHFSQAFTDFGVTAPTEYSGAAGMRSLLGPTSMAAAGVGSGSSQGTVVNLNIHPGAFQGVTDPVDHGNKVVKTIMDGISQLGAIDSARRGISPGG